MSEVEKLKLEIARLRRQNIKLKNDYNKVLEIAESYAKQLSDVRKCFSNIDSQMMAVNIETFNLPKKKKL
jgi:hypothetical protein